MKKPNPRSKKKKSPRKKSSTSKKSRGASLEAKSLPEKPVKQKAVHSVPKKATEKKKVKRGSILVFFSNARQFLRESKMELKKVKWPTRKELLASTGVVLVLTIIMAFFFFVVDFGLMRIIRFVLG